jgi:hypothetical protein
LARRQIQLAITSGMYFKLYPRCFKCHSFQQILTRIESISNKVHIRAMDRSYGNSAVSAMCDWQGLSIANGQSCGNQPS